MLVYRTLCHLSLRLVHHRIRIRRPAGGPTGQGKASGLWHSGLQPSHYPLLSVSIIPASCEFPFICNQSLPASLLAAKSVKLLSVSYAERRFLTLTQVKRAAPYGRCGKGMPVPMLRRDLTCAFTAGTYASPIRKVPNGTLSEAALRLTQVWSVKTPKKCVQAIAVSRGASSGPCRHGSRLDRRRPDGLYSCGASGLGCFRPWRKTPRLIRSQMRLST